MAIALERLIVRDGWSFEQAVEVLRTNHAVDESRDELYALHLKLLPSAPTRRFIPEIAARDVPSPTPAPDDDVMRAERDLSGIRCVCHSNGLARPWSLKNV